MPYIDTEHLFKCETCRFYRNGKCNTFCDAGESYSPNLAKIPTADVVPRGEAAKVFEEIEEIITKPFTAGFDVLSPLNQALREYNNGIRKEMLYYVAQLKEKYTKGGIE